MPEEYVTAGEFDRRMNSLEGLITRGFDKIEEKVDQHSDRLTVLETKTRNSASGWGAGAAAAIMGVFEIAKTVWGK